MTLPFKQTFAPIDFEFQDIEGVKNIDSSERQLRLFGLINGLFNLKEKRLLKYTLIFNLKNYFLINIFDLIYKSLILILELYFIF